MGPSASVDRLNQVPARLAFLFDYSAERALGDFGIRSEMSTDDARAVVSALARSWRRRRGSIARSIARGEPGEDEDRTEAKSLFHPIRIALTGRAEGRSWILRCRDRSRRRSAGVGGDPDRPRQSRARRRIRPRPRPDE